MSLKKLDRLAKRECSRIGTKTESGIGGEWLLASYADDGRGSYPTAQRAVESFIGQAQKLVGGSPSFQFKEHRDEGSVGGSLKNSRMFNIEIMGDAYIQGRTSGSMADLTVTVELERMSLADIAASVGRRSSTSDCSHAVEPHHLHRG